MAKLAVCIGINNYPGTANDLAGCVNDASDWADALKTRGFTVTKLLDAAAKKQAIVNALQGTISKAKSGDTVVLTYSGHGSWQPDKDGDEPDGRDEGWCPHDLSTKGLLLDDEMYDLFGLAATGVKLIMLSDSCHSGSVTRAFVTPPTPGVPKIRFMPPSVFLTKAALKLADRIAGNTTRVIKPDRALLISGCKDTEYSYDTSFNGRPNGAFTYYAIQALKKNPASYLAWHTLIRKSLPSTAQPQSPNLLGTTAQKNWPVL